MSTSLKQQQWEEYCTSEIARALPIFTKHGISLEEKQPHTQGERYLTRPIGGAKKLLLLGKDNLGKRVVIKVGSDKNGIAEIEHERVCRDTLMNMNFAHGVLHSPHEFFFTKEQGVAVMASEFLEQESSFTERPILEQFTLALSILKAQEQAHATTYGHTRIVRKTFGGMSVSDYLRKCEEHISAITAVKGEDTELQKTLKQSYSFIREHSKTIDQYNGFLTNWDLTPQNIRISKNQIYYLDHASFHFGNKHESWARFINFMALYQPQVAEALVSYVRDNRANEELLSLKIMRIYRLIELIRFYVEWINRTEGNTQKLALARIDFWHNVLKATLDDKFVSIETVVSYKKTRDALRSEDEKERQVALH